MWDLIVSVPDHCLSFCFVVRIWHNTGYRFSHDVAQTKS